MRARIDDEAMTVDGYPGAAPALTVVVTIVGLIAGTPTSLWATAAYTFEVLGCGVQPSPCVQGSGTTDPSVHLCRPEYSERTEGTIPAAVQSIANEQGVATAALRFVIPDSERPCPAGAGRPWYVLSGIWLITVADKEHGLELIGPPDFVIGP